jgi:DNA-directed RNA polymerase subunit RPC12/RpoP
VPTLLALVAAPSEGLERPIGRRHATGTMSGRAGSDCPECGGQLVSEDGMEYVCKDCGRRYDSADVFLI